MPLSSPELVLTAAVTIFAALILLWVAMMVARVRRRHKIMAPAMSGPLELECAIRAQGNSTEQAMIFFPLLWMAALFFHIIGWLVPALGLLWCLGRIVFVIGYIQAPSKRFAGFAISQFGTIGLLICAVIGVVQAWSVS